MKTKTDQYRIPNPKYGGKCIDSRTIQLMESRGVSAEYCIESKQIATYLFDITQWTEDEAKAWVAEHAKDYQIDEVKATTGMVEGKMVAIASTEDKDREGEVIKMDGWNLKSFKENPVLLWLHNMASGHNGLPVGTARNIKITEHSKKKVLQFEPVFDDSTEFNRTVKKMYEEGVMSTFSVGFMGHEKEGNKFVKQELLEISAVPVPANSSAVVIARAKELGIDKSKAMAVVDIKENVPFKSFALANEDKEWDLFAAESRVRKTAGGPDKDKIDMEKYSEAFAWFDKEAPDDIRSYKFLHHDGEGADFVTVWRGVKSAMGMLLKDTTLDDKEKEKVYDHLAKHYEEFEKDAPEFKALTTETVREIVKEIEAQNRIADYRETEKHLKEIRTEIRKQRREEKEDIIHDADMVEALKILYHSTGIALQKANDLERGHPKGKEVN